MTCIRIAMILAMTATMAHSEIRLAFIEGAPKDRFVLTTDSGVCADGPVRVTIDLEGSAGALIFDTTGQGAGVEVFQPFELVAGGDIVSALPQVNDGDTRVSLDLVGLGPGTEVAFTIDLDDTIDAREITVTDSEIEGATFSVEMSGTAAGAPFGTNATARLDWPGCTS